MTPIEGTVYRDNDQIEAVIKRTLLETGVIQRVKVNIRDKKSSVEVFAYSNKRTGGWRVDMEINKYNFTTRDTLEQMMAAVRDAFNYSARSTLDEWLKGYYPNYIKVMNLIVKDLSEHRP